MPDDCPTPFPVQESKEADDSFKVEGTVGEVVGVEVSRSLSDVDPVNGSSWVANVRLQGRGHNPTLIEKSNLPTIVGSLEHWHASVSSRLVSPRLVSPRLVSPRLVDGVSHDGTAVPTGKES